jgi:putative ABC transport system permease protein
LNDADQPLITAMFRNYILTAYRNLLRNKYFSAINIAGLAIGMAACIVIAQYIVFEKSYDRFHLNYDNIYRLVNVRHYPTHSDESAGSVVALGPAMKEIFPEVEEFVRCYKSERVFSFNDNPVFFSRVFGVDSTFFKIFSFPVVKGSSSNLLSKPNIVVLTQSASRALFGNEDPMGKTILQGQIPFTVEAVAADPPENSHLKFDVLFSFATDLLDPNYCYTCNNRNTYVLLDAQANPDDLQSKMDQVVRKLHPDPTLRREYRLQPLSAIHLNSHLRQEHEENGNVKSVIALTAVAALILIIAWLNYINLTTSMSIKRSGEVGIRKVNGSTRNNLIVQFLTESLFVNVMALVIALIIVQLVFPAFSAITSINASFTLLSNPGFWFTMLIVLIIGSLVYGFYPAFVVSAFKPIQALKGKASLPKSVYSMRLGLVFLQFTFSIVLVAGTITVYKQITYMKNVDLGMHIDQTLVVPIPNELRDLASDGFETELSQHPTIEKITYTSSIPGKESGNVGGGFRIENVSSENSLQVYLYYVNKNYFDFLSIDFLAGTGLVGDQLYNDKNTELVINDAARKAFGFDTPEEAIGKIIYHDADIVGRINGVVKDHHNQSLDNPIAPAFFEYTKGKGYYLIKGEPTSTKENLDLIKNSFIKNYPNYPFQYYFLDEQFNKQYNDHIRFGTVFGLFTMLAIFISCLGLSGLSMYVIKVRTKEIALRKVLGASVANLLLMLSKEYVRLTVVAFVVAAPISYFLIQKWLQNFFYRIEIAWWMFVIPGVLILAVALITVSAQSLKTALSKPADSLRNE